MVEEVPEDVHHESQEEIGNMKGLTREGLQNASLRGASSTAVGV